MQQQCPKAAAARRAQTCRPRSRQGCRLRPQPQPGQSGPTRGKQAPCATAAAPRRPKTAYATAHRIWAGRRGCRAPPKPPAQRRCAAPRQHHATVQHTQMAHRNALGGITRGDDAALRACGLRLRGKRRRLHALQLHTCWVGWGCVRRLTRVQHAAKAAATHSASLFRTAPARLHACPAPPQPLRLGSKPACTLGVSAATGAARVQQAPRLHIPLVQLHRSVRVRQRLAPVAQLQLRVRSVGVIHAILLRVAAALLDGLRVKRRSLTHVKRAAALHALVALRLRSARASVRP